MSNLTPEQRARQQIDAQLIACGWVVQDYKAVDLSAGRGIALREVPLKSGPCDYLLLVDRKAVGVVEAKKEGTTLSTVADQSGALRRKPSGFPRRRTHRHAAVPLRIHRRRDLLPRRARSAPALPPRVRVPSPGNARRVARRTRHAAPPPGADALRPSARRRNGMRDCQVEAITDLEQSFAEDRPARAHPDGHRRGQDLHRLRLHLPAHQARRGAARPVPRGPRQSRPSRPRDEFQQFVTPDTGRKFTELYNVQHLTSQHISTTSAASPSAPSSGSTRCCAARNSTKTLDEKSGYEIAARRRPPEGRRLQPRHPHRDLRLHRHRRVPPLHLQPLAAGARILRRLPHRPHRHARASRPSASSTRTSSRNTTTSAPSPMA